MRAAAAISTLALCCAALFLAEPARAAAAQPLPGASPAKNASTEEARLRGVVIARAPIDPASLPRAEAGLTLHDLDYFDIEALEARLLPFVGKSLEKENLDGIIQAVTLESRARGRGVVDVFLPRQRVTDGVIVIGVTVAKLGDVRVEGSRYFADRTLLDPIRLRPGADLDTDLLQRDLGWINQNQFRSVTAVYTPGQEPGSTDLVLKVDDRLPFRVFGGYANTGPKSTRHHRWTWGFTWGNAFGLGHRLDFQQTTSGEPLRSRALSYYLPLPWHGYLLGNASESKTETREQLVFERQSRSKQASLYYGHSLAPVTDWNIARHEFYGGLEWKRNLSTLRFAGIQVSRSNPEVFQAVLGYKASSVDEGGSTAVDLALRLSPGHVIDNNEEPEFEAVRAGTHPDYAYLRATVERNQDLGYGFTGRLRVIGQVTNRNLLFSEQLTAGGYDSVRGYEPDVISGDHGAIVNAEMYLPPLSPMKDWFGWSEPRDSLQPLVFFDWARMGPHRQKGLTDVDRGIAGMGFGLRYSIFPGGSMRLDIARALERRFEKKDTEPFRVHFGMSLGF